ncbi:MAG: BamA/TamA family outer membrane protein, partial [Bacteroidota bacterium]|nr:BamA/TamA family outer membrane protein [Bacteroidota bacterium]
FGTLEYDTREHPRLPMHGFLAALHASYYPIMLDNRRHFADGRLDLRAYLDLRDGLTLALRTRVQKIWGRYPFYQAATLGGSTVLRGYNRERFAGDASALGTCELRLRVGSVRLLFPGTWGVLAFADAGRVYYAGERSRTLHTSFGGGIWGGFADRRLTFSAQAALSSERLALSLNTGFTF